MMMINNLMMISKMILPTMTTSDDADQLCWIICILRVIAFDLITLGLVNIRDLQHYLF